MGSIQALDHTASSLDHYKAYRHAEKEDCPCAGLQRAHVRSSQERLHSALARMYEDTHKLCLDSQRVRAAVRRARRCCRDGKAGRNDPMRSSRNSWPVDRQLHGPSEHRGDLAAAAGHGHSPDNLLRSPHFQVMSALDAESLEAERDEIHVPAWYAGGMTAAARLPGGVLQRPGDGDWKFGASTQSRRARSRRDTGPTRRFPPASPDILDYQRRRMAKPAHPMSLPRRSVTNARNREQS